MGFRVVPFGAVGLALALSVWGCDSEEVDFGPGGAGGQPSAGGVPMGGEPVGGMSEGGAGGEPMGGTGGAVGGEGGIPGEPGTGGFAGGTGGEDVGVPPVVDCSAFEYRGQVFDCDALDRCTEQDILYRTACCQCDPELCAPDPDCSAPDDAGLPPPEVDGGAPPPPVEIVESCMECHNGSDDNDYAGNGILNPHPFPGAANILCSHCHGGNPRGQGKLDSHVNAPPEIGGREQWINNPKSYFNRLTLSGLDKLEPAEWPTHHDPDATWNNLDYIQFLNPGDLRVVTQGRGCGAAGCHGEQHGEWVARSAIGTTVGFFSSTRFTVGLENSYPERRGRQNDADTLADHAPRDVSNPDYDPNNRLIGEVPSLREQEEVAQYDGPMRDNAIYDSDTLPNHVINENQDRARPNRVRTDSPLDTLITESISIGCGDCHLYSAGANNRYADFRSSGCTACHMEYSADGRSRSSDPHVNKREPINPDAIAAPERPHVERHQIRNVAKVLPNGAFVRGISDRACVGCHQGSNRTVLQYWGIRLDQNADVVNDFQYPANPQNFATTENDTRLYDPAVNNNTFNGRNFNQHLLTEDYDGDNRDDTPPDVHYAAGMGCIDCHGSRDLHGGTEGDPTGGKIRSRNDQYSMISCESCHGTLEGYAETVECFTYDNRQARCATDKAGNPLRNVTVGPNDTYTLISRLDGNRLYVPQTRDVVVQNQNKRHPITQQLIYSPKGSYAMGRADGSALTGIGPQQADPLKFTPGFTHMDKLECVSCHSTWTNNCIGCHIKSQYNADPGQYFFSNITGERILLNLTNADFTYQSPVMMYLGVNSNGKIDQVQPMDKLFYRHEDRNGVESQVFAFGDRLGEGNNPFKFGANAFPALSHNQTSNHSVRGKVTDTEEGPRYCVSCHLTQNAIDTFGDEYAEFRDTYYANDFANLDFDLLAEHIGQNPGNQLDSPFWVHMVAGLGTGLFLFDETGCPVNPLDPNANRQYCPDGAPADNFDANDVVYDTDRLVEINGASNVSSAHPIMVDNPPVQRFGASNPEMSGPLPGQMIQKLADPNTGLVLDSWIDADGNAQGAADNYINQ
ncbi:MAG: hypothetical protein ACE366_20380 [Bradymonadia bacterium]